MIAIQYSYSAQHTLNYFKEQLQVNMTLSSWQKTKRHSGISKDFYDEYFLNKEMAYAIEVGKIKPYSQPFLLADFGIEYAPQSYIYI
ncbi:MAG: hypothetical protein GX612_07400 [Bacteroidales bacterium]|nr:hypothetical protein [Bacteroidales bacterium]